MGQKLTKEPKTDSWSLPPLVVDKVVSVLKQTRRWRLDGPSLRLLNKQWSRLIDQHIFEVRPHPVRRLVLEDVASLRKFPRLTSLDVGPFILPGVKPLISLAPAETNTIKDEEEHFSTDYDILRVVDILLQLPKLSHLEVGASLVRRRDGRYSFLHIAWTALESVTSLFIYNDVNFNIYGTSPSNAFGFLKGAEERDPLRLAEVTSFVSLFPRIRNVEMAISEKKIRLFEGLYLLNKINGLKLLVEGSSRFICSNSNPTAVVGIALTGEAPKTLDFLIPFERLETLKINALLNLRDEATVSVCKRLTSLTLCGDWNSPCFISHDCFDVFDQLRDLTLDGVSLYGAHLKGRLLNLTSLAFSCSVEDGCLSFLADMENLRHLSLGHMHDGDKQSMTHYLSDLRLPQAVRSLYLNNVSNCTLSCIARLTQLEAVFVNFDSGTQDGISHVESLSALRVLGFSALPLRNQAPIDELLSPNLLTRLERIFLNDWKSSEKRMRKILSKKAPRLIVEFKCMDRHFARNRGIL